MTAPLPGILAEVAEVAGFPAALAFAARAGGTRVYIPAAVDADHWLVECLGRAAAEKLCARLGGGRYDVPVASHGAYARLRRSIARRVHEMDQAGKSAAEIARTTGITQRSVHNHRAAHRGQRRRSKQRSLL